jgi:aspartyl-tRNA synthetase
MQIFADVFTQVLEEKANKPKHDACYRKAKSKYGKDFPSLYAAGYMAKCRKRKGKIK